MAKTKKCPVCGTYTRIENLEKHVKKVHPREKVDIEYSEKEEGEIRRVERRKKEVTAVSNKKLYAVVAAVIVIALIAAIYFYIPSEQVSGENPKAVLPDGAYHDFGSLTNPTDLTHVFSIRNDGEDTLVLSKIETSCHCTTASLVLNGQTNGPFGMAGDGSPSGWNERIDPGESATLTVNYDTKFHGLPGDAGEQVRDIFVETNDSSNSRIKFEIVVDITRI
jgi:hypothetical protein